jgi:diadenylate cyclase
VTPRGLGARAPTAGLDRLQPHEPAIVPASPVPGPGGSSDNAWMSERDLVVATDRTREDLLRSTLAAVAPGTALRDGLERILRGRTGALIVLGYDDAVEEICTGGFPLDVEFSSTRLRELAKMDGGIVTDHEITHILRAAVQFVPDSAIETSESGTRHRTAERVAKQTGYPVISVSASMRIVALYVAGLRYVLEGSDAILGKSNQALATLERYKARLDEVTSTLSALEIEDLVTVRDVSVVVQRLEMVRRISEEIAHYVVELGTDGRLLSLQLDELIGGVSPDRDLVVRDYLESTRRDRSMTDVVDALADIPASELVDLGAVARVLGFGNVGDALDTAVSPKGYRLLTKIPRLPATIVERLVDHFGDLQKLLAANLDDLMLVEGVGEQRARAVREGLSRLAESSILERYICATRARAASTRRSSAGTPPTRVTCRGGRRTGRRGACWSARSCCSRRRSCGCCPPGGSGWRGGRRPPTWRPSRRGLRCRPGAGSGTRGGRCGCTRPRPRSSSGTAARCRPTTPRCWRCRGSGRTRPPRWRRSRSASGTSSSTRTCAGCSPGWPAGRSTRHRRSPSPRRDGRPAWCRTTPRARRRGPSR